MLSFSNSIHFRMSILKPNRNVFVPNKQHISYIILYIRYNLSLFLVFREIARVITLLIFLEQTLFNFTRLDLLGWVFESNFILISRNQLNLQEPKT